MRNSTPLAPENDVTVYIVLNDFAQLGRAYVETDEALADERTIIQALIAGEYSNPLRIVAFNTHEGWSRDVTEDIALKLLEMSREGVVLAAAAREFAERVTGQAATVIV